jgi:hypothetical protein
MADKTYSLLAVLHELNRRELKKKLGLFPEDLHYYVTAAIGIIGSENAKRVKETPDGVKENSEEFISKLLGIISLDETESFKEVLGTCLAETLRDELKFCCLNCIRFEHCLDIGNLSVGDLFFRRTKGEETPEIRASISEEVEAALRKTPYIDSDEADRLCDRFLHQYEPGNIGEVFGRYGEIAVALQNRYGLDYRKVLQQMVILNMEFIERTSPKKK